MTLPPCPACQSTHIVKNGKIHNGKQNLKCRDCGGQFVQDPKNKCISPETKALINKLLLEKIPLAGIARIVGVSESWLQSYVNGKYDKGGDHPCKGFDMAQVSKGRVLTQEIEQLSIKRGGFCHGIIAIFVVNFGVLW